MKSYQFIEILDKIVFWLYSGIFDIDFIADLIIAFDILPQSKTGSEINIFHDGVGTHNRRTDERIAQCLA